MEKTDLKIRIDKATFNELTDKSNEISIPKARLIRDGVKLIIKLLNGVTKENLESYIISYEALSRKVDTVNSRAEKDILIKQVTKCLDGLYDLMEKVRDEQLANLDLEYKELFENEISVTIPVDKALFEWQKKYYELVKCLYEKKVY
ncbi:ribbon-helix-helix domain-containing protein [Clostridium thermobutyricum]|uniref:ribbon-helix-helix domain-containing protein n=1 Tax=Clostridium thermobutyricum TaxID=29372 RepID=UPI0018AB64DF|nr:ribbon-helix-helix domain-containing protein [Clostridium thermobutyricum]